MLRILMLLLALAAALPAMAQTRENTAANALFVQAMRDFHAARAIELPPFPRSREEHQVLSDEARRKHASLKAVQQKLGLLIERYPGSDLAVQLITGQPIGGFGAGLLEQEIAYAGSLIATPQEIERAEAERVAERRRQAELQRRREEAAGAARQRIAAERDEVAALLRTLRPTPQQAPPQQAAVTPGGGQEVGSLRRQVEDKWVKDHGARGIESFVVDIRVTLDASGVVKSAEIVKTQGAPADSLNAFAQGARRAVFIASPLKIPPGRSDLLDGNLILTFRGAER